MCGGGGQLLRLSARILTYAIIAFLWVLLGAASVILAIKAGLIRPDQVRKGGGQVLVGGREVLVGGRCFRHSCHSRPTSFGLTRCGREGGRCLWEGAREKESGWREFVREGGRGER